MRSPVTRTTAFLSGAPPRPSIRVPARIAITGFGCAIAAEIGASARITLVSAGPRVERITSSFGGNWELGSSERNRLAMR
jgi:hypothetical protein